MERGEKRGLIELLLGGQAGRGNTNGLVAGVLDMAEHIAVRFLGLLANSEQHHPGFVTRACVLQDVRSHARQLSWAWQRTRNEGRRGPDHQAKGLLVRTLPTYRARHHLPEVLNRPRAIGKNPGLMTRTWSPSKPKSGSCPWRESACAHKRARVVRHADRVSDEEADHREGRRDGR
jgi:hypothetical protein